MTAANRKESAEQVNGFDRRLFDGYDGAAKEPSDAYIEKLLASAPEAVRARIAEAAREKAAGQK